MTAPREILPPSLEGLPHNIDAEVSLLGCVITDNDQFETVSHVEGRHFAEAFHGRLWEAMAKLIRSEKLAEPTRLHEAFRDDPVYHELGGLTYIAELVYRAPSPELAAHYAEIVADLALRRDIVRLTSHVAEQARQGEGEAALAVLEHEAAEMARTGSGVSHGELIGASILSMIDAAWSGGFRGVSTGLECLDRVTGGIRQDGVWIVGGRTSMGKSVAAGMLARNLAEQGRGVVFNSLEMPLAEVQARITANVAYDPERRYDGAGFENLRYGDILKGRGTPDSHQRAKAAAHKVATLPIHVDDAGGLTIDDIRSRAQRRFREWEKQGVQRGALIIDHIGLVKPASRRASDSKAAETADIVNELKALAKYLRAPVIALVQINRNTENRNDHRPTLGDLNWSGAIEQIADLICLLYRESYYLERSASREDQDRAVELENELELLIHKNRSGPICTVKAFVDIASNAILDLPGEERR